MSLKLVVRRLLFLVLVVWSASTITFFVPRLSDRNALRERFAELSRTGGFAPADLEKIIASYSQQFGLNKPLWQQYLDYLSGVLRLDFGYSLNRYPSTVIQLIEQALPWTMGLLIVTTILSFVIGNLLGALAAWQRSPRWVRALRDAFRAAAGRAARAARRAAAVLRRLPAQAGCRSAAPIRSALFPTGPGASCWIRSPIRSCPPSR